MRFDDEGYVKTWHDEGIWPTIHQPIFELVMAEASGLALVDLGCSTGLLGLHLKRNGFEAVGIDGDEEAVALADAYGVTKEMPIRLLTIDASAPSTLTDVIREVGATMLVARRCFPEIFEGKLTWGSGFARALRDAGIREVFIQGRLASTRTTNPLGNVEAEVALLQAAYRPVFVRGQLAYLKSLEK